MIFSFSHLLPVLALALACDRVLTSISPMALLPTFVIEVASSAVLHPFRLLPGTEIRSNRIQIGHDNLSIFVFVS